MSRRDEEIQRTSVFSAYYGKSERVRDIIAMRGKYERIKYLSSAYRFNGKVLPILKNLRVHPDGKFNGFVGLEGSLDPAMAAAENPTAGWGDDSGAVWAPKLEYLREIAGRCRKNGTRLILFHSPYFEEDEATLKAWLTRLAALHLDREGIEYLDLSERTHPLFAGRPDLFKDRSHLNSKGAVLFSTALANELAGRIGPKLTR